MKKVPGKRQAACRITVVPLLLIALAASAAACGKASESAPARDEKVLRVVPQSDLEVLDPTWTAAYVTRDHGFMIYDTLFGMDSERNIKPQMVETYQVSDDRKTWTFTLRDGLKFHDGTPVTSDDAIASIQRWGRRDTFGQRLLNVTSKWEALDARTFRMTLKVPYGLVLESLSKPDSYVPFILPKRLADTPADKQITDITGSGPFVFKKEEWKPGEKIVYVRNPNYRPRGEPASGTAGGKAAKVDRIEWVVIKDPQTQVNALIAGEIDMVVEPPYALYSLLKSNSAIQMVAANPQGYFFFLRFNHVQPPFDNPKVRQAAMAALNQPAFLQTQVGLPDLSGVCFSVYPCATPYSGSEGMNFISQPDPEKARELLKQSGYAGMPIVILHAPDYSTLEKLPRVAAQLLRQAGFNVDLQSVNYNTVLTRRARKDGWNVFLGYGAAWSSAMPVSLNLLSAAGYPEALYGWPKDQELERLRDAFTLAGSNEERRALATQIQVRAMEVGTHVPLGEFRTMLAARTYVKGFVTGPITAFWNLEKR
jgi:peptide/nickel transport system substrate-binding protein